MKHTLKLSLILTLFINVLYSQSNNDVARAYYVEAEKNYEINNYSKALSNIKEIEDILKGTNSRVLGLKIKVLYAKGDYNSAKKNLNLFFKYESTEALKNEILGYLVKINDKIEEENKRAIKEAENQRLLELKKEKERKFIEERDKHITFINTPWLGVFKKNGRKVIFKIKDKNKISFRWRVPERRDEMTWRGEFHFKYIKSIEITGNKVNIILNQNQIVRVTGITDISDNFNREYYSVAFTITDDIEKKKKMLEALKFFTDQY